MIRQKIDIGSGYEYIVDLFKAFSEPDIVYQNFVILRKFNILDELTYDTDIYFIEKTIYDDILYGKNIEIIYPASNSTNKYFSTDYSNFNSDIRFTSAIYELYDKDLNKCSVPCDRLQVYHPHTKINLNAIIYIDNVINGIHYHYYCKRYEEIESCVGAEFTSNNNIYCEYATIYIPNIEYIFGGNIFIKENLGNITEESIKELPNKERYVIFSGDEIYCSFNLINIPFYPHKNKETQQTIKYFSKNALDLTVSNYSSYPIKVTLYPYDNVKDSYYMLDGTINSGTDIFMNDDRFYVSTYFDFIHESDAEAPIKLVSDIRYPNENLYGSFREAYEKLNNVVFSEYNNIVLEEEDEDYIEGENNIVSQIGYRVVISSDPEFKNIIHQEYFEVSNPDEAITYDDKYAKFCFDISGIFSKWEEMPEIIVCQTQFIDKYLGTVIPGNSTVLTKEWFKYLVNKKGRIVFDMSNFNFIDKVTCVIKKESDTQQNIVLNNTPKILYKPMFYKVQDLENIQIRYGVTQNIGINLGDYLTKVDTFKLQINGVEYIEKARNDIYVIFAVNGAGKFTSNIGTYHILNQDSEYISSGNWTLIA